MSEMRKVQSEQQGMDRTKIEGRMGMRRSMTAFSASMQDLREMRKISSQKDFTQVKGSMRRQSTLHTSAMDLHAMDDSLTFRDDEIEEDSDEDEDDDSKTPAPTVQKTPSLLGRKSRRGSFSEDPAEKRGQMLAVAWAAGMTIAAGCSATATFELLTKGDKGCSHFILFVQNIYAMIECLCTDGVKKFFVDRKMPWRFHFGSALFEVVRMQFFNYAVDMGLPMPVVLVIKNSGLCVSVLLGVFLQGKRYGGKQILGVVAITAGVLLATFASKPAPKPTAAVASGESVDGSSFTFGLALMIGGVLVTALMNVFQEAGFKEYGPHFKETAFYAAALYALMKSFESLGHVARVVAWSKHWVDVSFLPFPVPMRWILLLMYMPSAALMKTNCLTLTGLAGQVANTVTVTVFRFVSLVLSGCVLNAPPYPPLSFWVGGVLVMMGTFGYAMHPPPKPKAGPSTKKQQ